MISVVIQLLSSRQSSLLQLFEHSVRVATRWHLPSTSSCCIFTLYDMWMKHVPCDILAVSLVNVINNVKIFPYSVRRALVFELVHTVSQPAVINQPFCCHYCPPGPRLPSQPHSTTAIWPGFSRLVSGWNLEGPWKCLNLSFMPYVLHTLQSLRNA